MSPEEWGRIRELYEAGKDLDAVARHALLTGESAAVREEVERLLGAHDRTLHWLDRPLAGAAARFAGMEARQVGGYTIVREIGRGGMGAVFLAERSDGAFHKQAAVKVLLPGPHSAEILVRFQQEREILASLEHPNIARLLDGGTTEEGWSYFVMEYVEGLPINRYCDEHRLNVSRRIELFRGVLAAVRYAHQRLVVHRDLKPGNILVTREGTVKLLDFGIAKILEPGRPGEAPATNTLAQMMTPEYASPEQVSGAPITTLTDEYSLGVVLYELLTGSKPYPLRRAMLHEMARVILEEEPARPSVTASADEAASRVREGDPVRLRKRLEGDLDSVLLKALAKEPERRYSSVEALEEDLSRHLDLRPVTAREPTLWYRSRRFVRRNPGGVVATLFVAMAAAGGVFSVVLLMRRDLAVAPSAEILGPFWILFSGLVPILFGATVYFLRPDQRRIMGALAAGFVLVLSALTKYWLGARLGWHWTRLPGGIDPMFRLLPATLALGSVYAGTMMLWIKWIGNRFGWRAMILAALAFSLLSEVRERVWLHDVLPVLDYRPGLAPVAIGAAALLCGTLLGLWVSSFVGGSQKR